MASTDGVPITKQRCRTVLQLLSGLSCMDNRIDQITTCPLTPVAVTKRAHSMTDSPEDRRRFKRIAFDAKTELKQGDQTEGSTGRPFPERPADRATRVMDRRSGATL